MMSTKLPDLTFPEVSYGGTEVPLDLQCLLFVGGAGANARTLSELIDSGLLGKPERSRLPMIRALHGELNDRLAAGGSRRTLKSSIRLLRLMYSWVDSNPINDTPHLTHKSIRADFIRWTDHLITRVRELRDLKAKTAVSYGTLVGSLIDAALDIRNPTFKNTRLFAALSSRRRSGPKDKQNLEHTLAFGNVLLDICKSLTAEAIRSPLPIKLAFRDGTVIDEWTRLRDPSKVRALADGAPDSWSTRMVRSQREAWSEDYSLRTRRPIANLRIEAELLIFISQTGMNLAQAHTMKIGSFSYASHLDGYRVHRRYKARRQGEVEFDIYSEYRPHFESYLAWRKEMIGSDSDELFPILSAQNRAQDVAPTFSAVRKRMDILGVPFVTPRSLRGARINWIRRRSNDKISADVGQHSLATSLRSYDAPSHQLALVEISKFHDYSVAKIEAPGPVDCEGGSPIPAGDSSAAQPDCISPAGCLFCGRHRDIDAAEHMWSLATFRHLKSLELIRHRPSTSDTGRHPAEEAISVITSKFEELSKSSEVRAMWIAEAMARIEEGDYHPKWEGFVTLMELRR